MTFQGIVGVDVSLEMICHSGRRGLKISAQEDDGLGHRTLNGKKLSGDHQKSFCVL